MPRYKLTFLSTLLLIAFCFPSSSNATSTSILNATVSIQLAEHGPKKKIKKKRKHPLDRKAKMKNGKHCPSF